MRTEGEKMRKSYEWTSNKADTVHTLRIYEGGKVVATLRKIDGATLNACVKELEAAGYTHRG